MEEVIIFGDIEEALRVHLTAELPDFTADSVTVAVTRPNPMSTRLVLVPRLGGPKRDIVTDGATIGVECFAPTHSGALELAQLARGIIEALPGKTISGLPVYRVQEFAGPAMLPDPDSDTPRYVFTVRVEFRGTTRERTS